MSIDTLVGAMRQKMPNFGGALFPSGVSGGVAPSVGPFPPSNAAIPVPAISSLLGVDMAARQPWVRVKRKRSKRSNFNKWGLV